MKIQRNKIKKLSAVLLMLITTAVAYSQNNAGQTTSPTGVVSEAVQQLRLNLIDGTSIDVDETWESEQGVWYRRGGISHLIARDRIKKTGRGTASRHNAEPATTSVVVPVYPETAVNNAVGSVAEAVWIYLVGGARFEADRAIESTAGVWYTRGSLSIFVERSRIDHIEREELESMAESDSILKKERGWTTGSQRIDSLIRNNGAKYGVDPYLIFCVMEQESHFNTRALSPKGARGLMQLMPGTSARFGVRTASDPAQNIAGGTRYLKQLMGQFDGRIDLVLASYNAGEGAVLKFGRRVPPYRETRDYVKRISYRYHRTKLAVVSKNGLGPVAKAASPEVVRVLPIQKKQELDNE